jgi:transcriptional regulator with XRE-family HTH domain
MALFFDKEWFDAKLESAHLSRADLARALGLTDTQVAEIWKDQRELSAHEVSLMAALLAVSPQDVAQYAGVSTPVPQAAPTVAELHARLMKVEKSLNEIRALLERKSGA